MLSILLLNWNHGQFLEQCVRSLASQTSKSFEILFLDNASTDGSYEQARRLFERSGLHAKLLSNKQPRGISHNFNRLLAESSGKLISPLATDDWYEPDYVEKMLAAAATHPTAGWFYPSGWYFYEDQGVDVEVPEGRLREEDIEQELVRGGYPVFHVGCCYRREALEQVGGWDEDQLIEDRDLFLRLAADHRVHFVRKRLVHYRRSSTATSINVDYMVEGWERLFAKHRHRFSRIFSQQLASTYRSYAALAVDQGKLRTAARLLVKSLRHQPMQLAALRTWAYLIRASLGSSRQVHD